MRSGCQRGQTLCGPSSRLQMAAFLLWPRMEEPASSVAAVIRALIQLMRALP